MPTDIIARDAQRICDAVDLDALRNASVLVTGASGLVGSYLLATLCELRKRGFATRVFAQMLSPPPPHVAELIARGGIEPVRVDLSAEDTYAALPGADFIVHSAGYAQPLAFMANPVAAIQVNTSATVALLRRLRPDGRFLFVSSTEVYSGIQQPMAAETDIGRATPYHPRSAYIEGKRCGEAICHAFRAEGKVASSARLGHTYGPGTRKHDKRALYSFIERGLCEGRIQLLDSGTTERTYGYVADAVGSLLQILLRGKEAVYNVGGASTVTIAELARAIGRLTGAEVIIPSEGVEVPGAPRDVVLDLTRLRSEFRASPMVSLEEGLGATVDWQRGLYASSPEVSGSR